VLLLPLASGGNRQEDCRGEGSEKRYRAEV